MYIFLITDTENTNNDTLNAKINNTSLFFDEVQTTTSTTVQQKYIRS